MRAESLRLWPTFSTQAYLAPSEGFFTNISDPGIMVLGVGCSNALRIPSNHMQLITEASNLAEIFIPLLCFTLQETPVF